MERLTGVLDGNRRSASFEFSVRYRLGEYLQVVSEHAFATETSLAELKGVRRTLARAALKCVATVMFVFKSLRVGRCDFTVDAARVCRRAKGGEGCVPWSKVKAVHTYTSSYLVELQEGAMPIPFRVLGADQRELLHRFAGDLMLREPAVR